MARICEMKQKEVINICDGVRIGFVSDVEFCTEKGKMTAIIIPGPGKFWSIFGREKEYIIAWEKIKKIGDDIILVDVKLEDVLLDCKF